MVDARRKYQLFRQSQHFCSVPWNHLFFDTNGDVRTCVASPMVLGNINTQSIEQILQSSLLREIRHSLYNDQAHPNCVKCQSLSHDESGRPYRFLRDMYNERFLKSQVDYADTSAFVLSGLDMHWSNTCNLRCITCWAKQSSAIAAEIGITVSAPQGQTIQDLIQFITDNQSGLREIYLSGGEPTLIKHNLKLLQLIEPRDDLLLRVNSNCAWPQNNAVLQRILEFPNVLFTISADGMHQRFEYIRSGASWKQFEQNVSYLAGTHARLRVNSVFCVPSAHELISTQNYFREHHGVADFTINQCSMDQFAIMCRNLPEKLKNQLRHDLQRECDIHSSDHNLQGQIQNCLRELDHPANGHDYHDFFADIDRRRGTHWRDIFQELT